MHLMQTSLPLPGISLVAMTELPLAALILVISAEVLTCSSLRILILMPVMVLGRPREN